MHTFGTWQHVVSLTTSETALKSCVLQEKHSQTQHPLKRNEGTNWWASPPSLRMRLLATVRCQDVAGLRLRALPQNNSTRHQVNWLQTSSASKTLALAKPRTQWALTDAIAYKTLKPPVATFMFLANFDSQVSISLSTCSFNPPPLHLWCC